MRVDLKFETQLVAELPALAWLLSVSSRPQHARLLHGRSVAASEEGYAEGAWDGPYSLASLRDARLVVGSGSWVEGSTVRIRTSSHTLERIWLINQSGTTWASNSLPLLLAGTGCSMDPRYVHYEADFLSFCLGPRRMRRRVPLASSTTLQQFTDCTISITPGQDPGIEQNSWAQAYSTFGDYRADLRRMGQSIMENAKASTRPRTYEALATVSRGYDSPACAVLARECGATQAFTFSAARAGFSSSDDDGSEIGQALNMAVTRLDRHAYRLGDGSAEAMFLASGGGGEDVVFAAAETLLAGSVVFTGFLGDTM